MRRWAFLVLVFGLGCGPNVPEGRFACTTDDMCPDGWSCVSGLCFSEPGAADGGMDASTDAGEPDPDAGADAGPGIDGGCVGGLTLCANRGMCVDLQTDSMSCGSCDNDCGADSCVDGQCRPAVTDIVTFGLTGDDVARAVAEFNGRIFVAGEFRDTVDFGGGTTLTSAGDVDGFIAAFTSAGVLEWVTRIGGSQFDTVYDVAYDATSGRVIAVGEFDPAFDGVATVETAGTVEMIANTGNSADAYVLSLDASNGSYQQLLATTGVGGERFSAVAIDAGGNIFLAGGHDSPFTVGGLSVPNSGFFDAFLVQYDATANSFSNLYQVATSGVDAFDGVTIVDQNVCATGFFSGDAMLGTSLVPVVGGTDGVIVCVRDGLYQWSQTIATAGDDQIHKVHWDGGDIAFVAVVGESVFFDPATIPAPAGVWDIVVGTMTRAGVPGWARVISTPGNFDFPLNVRALPDGRVLATGITTGAVTSPISLPHGGGNDGMIGLWSSDGTREWVRTFGGMGDDTVQDVVVVGSTIYAVGELTGPVDFGTGTVPGRGARDAYLMQIAF